MAKIFVTGGTGFIGKHLTNLLEQSNHEFYVYPYMMNEPALFQDKLHTDLFEYGPDYIIHLAGLNGGIQYNKDHAATIFSENTMMALELFNACKYLAKLKKIIFTISSCAYPDYGQDLLEEDTILLGAPNSSIAAHAYAKRNLMLTAQFFKQQYNVDYLALCPNTVYGPYDRIDPKRAKVMSSLIVKFVAAQKYKEESVKCWGSGKPIREFIYVKDVAKLILMSIIDEWESDFPINLADGQYMSIMELAELIKDKTGYIGDIEWDATKPDGQYKKVLDTSTLKWLAPTFKFTSLEQGIVETIEDVRKRI